MRPLLTIVFLAPLLLAACDSSDSGDGPPTNPLRYTLQLEHEGATVATGDLTFSTAPQPGATAISGTYTLQWTDGTELPPSGTFGGSYEGDSLIVRIAPPNISDSGIRLVGAYSATTYSGRWDAITVAGPEPQGTFVATQSSN